MNVQENPPSSMVSGADAPRGGAPMMDDEIDLLELFGRLMARKWFIICLTALFAVCSVIYALMATPIYRAQALVQIEAKEGGMPGLDELSGMFSIESEAVTEIELVKSRMVLGETVDQLQLDVVIQPHYFPFIGEFMARRFNSVDGEVAEPMISGYAWGGEVLEIAEFSIPRRLHGAGFLIRAEGDDQFTLLLDEEALIEGRTGERLVSENGDIALQVKTLRANAGTRFDVTRIDRLRAIAGLQASVAVSERGRQSGILSIHMDGPKPPRVEKILDTVVTTYVRKNVDRNAAEVVKSLEFLQGQLPEIRMELEAAEAKLNEYQVSAESVNILAETEALLSQIVALEQQISELQLREVEVKRLYRPDHPTYTALVDQMQELRSRRTEFQDQIKQLPETQQRLLRLRRDVEVNTEIYTQMLNNIQELDILRAGTIGNVRVVDDAEVNTYAPVAPRKSLIVALATVMGGFIAVIIVLVQAALRRGVENPEDIEAIGLPVYAAIPYSEKQAAIEKALGSRRRTTRSAESKLLAVTDPTDVSVEALRSLRTSIHFAMVEANNKVMMITGPSPFVGKSFVSTNLAVTMAMAGKKVLLVDTDMRKGYLHKLFNMDKHSGLSDYLSGQLELSSLIKSTEVENLSLVTHGTTPPNPSELLMSHRFEELLAALEADYDLILLDTPPILAVTDAAIIGRCVGTTMLVTRFQMNTVKEIEVSMRRLEQNGIEAKGCIFNAIKRVSAGYGYGYGGYGYGYGSGYYTYDYKQT